MWRSELRRAQGVVTQTVIHKLKRLLLNCVRFAHCLRIVCALFAYCFQFLSVYQRQGKLMKRFSKQHFLSILWFLTKSESCNNPKLLHVACLDKTQLLILFCSLNFDVLNVTYAQSNSTFSCRYVSQPIKPSGTQTQLWLTYDNDVWRMTINDIAIIALVATCMGYTNNYTDILSKYTLMSSH